MPFVSAIDSHSCVPSIVAQGGTITCEIDLAAGNTEKNQAYNITFWNDTAQTIGITGCSFSGTTENSPDPIDVIQGCTIPSDFGPSTTAVVNFTLTSLDLETLFNFNISETTSSTLIIDEIKIETPILVGKQTGVSWTVSKQDTGKAIVGSLCTGDLLQLIGGELIPIAGSSIEAFSPISKYAGHALTSFVPSVVNTNEGINYILEIRCDCIPGNTGCLDEDANVLVNSSSSTGLIGIGTSIISISTWLTVNTVTDKGNYEVGETVEVCANITNPANRSRQAVSIEYNLRCDSGSDSDTNRILLEDHVELRGVNGNTTQMQCHDFKVPDVETLEKGANNCQGATDVTVMDELLNPLVTYSTIAPRINITTSRIHPEIFWDRVSRNIYFSNVSFNAFDVGVKSVEVTINQLMHEPDTHATAIKNVSVTYFNGTVVPYEVIVSVHERFVRLTEEDESVKDFDVVTISIRDVNTTLDENFNVTIEFVDFQNRQATALEGINASAGTFDFSILADDTFLATTMVTGNGLTGDGRILNRDVNVTCQVVDYPETIKEFRIFVTDTFSFTEEIKVPTTSNTYTMRCQVVDRFFGEDAVEAFSNFQVLPKGFIGVGIELIKRNKITFFIILIIILILVVVIVRHFVNKRKAKDSVRNFG